MASTNPAGLTTLRIITYAMIAGATLLTLVTYYLISQEIVIPTGPLFSPSLDPLIVAGFGLLMIGNALTFIPRMFGSSGRITEINRRNPDPKSAAQRYMTYTILRFAVLEGAAFLSAMLALVTGQIQLLLVAVVLIFVMITIRPTEEELAKFG